MFFLCRFFLSSSNEKKAPTFSHVRSVTSVRPRILYYCSSVASLVSIFPCFLFSHWFLPPWHPQSECESFSFFLLLKHLLRKITWVHLLFVFSFLSKTNEFFWRKKKYLSPVVLQEHRDHCDENCEHDDAEVVRERPLAVRGRVRVRPRRVVVRGPAARLRPLPALAEPRRR